MAEFFDRSRYMGPLQRTAGERPGRPWWMRRQQPAVGQPVQAQQVRPDGVPGQSLTGMLASAPMPLGPPPPVAVATPAVTLGVQNSAPVGPIAATAAPTAVQQAAQRFAPVQPAIAAAQSAQPFALPPVAQVAQTTPAQFAATPAASMSDYAGGQPVAKAAPVAAPASMDGAARPANVQGAQKKKPEDYMDPLRSAAAGDY